MSMQTIATQVPEVAAWKCATLRRSAKAPRQARLAVQQWLSGSDPAIRSSALLVVSELVTNAFQHVPTGVQREWVKVRLGMAGDFIRLEVIDPGTTAPEPHFEALEYASMRQSGRGLGLVAAQAVRYGTYLLTCGHRVVWADLGTPLNA